MLKKKKNNLDVLNNTLNKSTEGFKKTDTQKIVDKKEFKLDESDLAKDKDIILVETDKLIPAPTEWNVFDPWTKSEMEENKFSILKHGLINPIIITPYNEEYSTYYTSDIPTEDRYIILAGHNRVQAYKELLEDAKKETDIERFSTIPAIIMENIDTAKAVEIIVDSNLKCRKSISKQNQLAASKLTIDTLKKQKNLDGKTIAQVLESKKLSKSKIYEDITIADKVHPSLLIYYYSNRLNKKSMLKLAQFDKKVQKEIAKHLKQVELADKELNYNIKHLKADMDQETIISTIDGKDVKKTIIKYIEIPTDLEESFERMLKDWQEKNNLNK